MHQVKCVLGQITGCEVELSDFDIAFMKLIEKSSIEIGGDYAAGGTYFSAQPLGDGASTGSGFEARPASRNTDRLETAEGRRVQALL